MATSTPLLKADVLKILNQVQDPDLKRGLVDLGMIEDLEISAMGQIKLRVVLTTPACPLKAQIEQEVRTTLQKIPGVTQVFIKMDAKVSRGSQVKAASSSTRGMQPIPGVAHIVAVSSGKGGVGKSSVAANLAVALTQEGARVGLLDADVYGPNIPTMLGLTEEPKLIHHPERGELFEPVVAYGVKVMSMGFLIKNDQPLIWRGPMLHSVVSQFCMQVAWGELDYLIVDMPPGTGDVQLSLAQLVPVSGAILVTTPQEVSLQDVRKAYYMFEKVRIPLLGIVENMSYFECGKCSTRHALFGKDGGVLLAKKFRTEILAQLPISQKIREGGDEGRPVGVSEPDSENAKLFRALAQKVAQRLSILSLSGEGASPNIEIGEFN